MDREGVADERRPSRRAFDFERLVERGAGQKNARLGQIFEETTLRHAEPRRIAALQSPTRAMHRRGALCRDVRRRVLPDFEPLAQAILAV
jgi:hypothetical protein